MGLSLNLNQKISKKISKNWAKVKINHFSSPLLDSDQLPTFFFILSSRLGGFAFALLLHPPKSDDKMKKKVGHSCIRKVDFLQNAHFRI